MRRAVWFRSWFYFRQGWSTYFAFIFAAINTLTVTYYLAIENVPILKQFFPTFSLYLLIAATIGIPFLVTIGYVHYKRSPAFKAEAAINVESNPYIKRLIENVEIILQAQLRTTQTISKFIRNEKLTTDDLNNLTKWEDELLSQINGKLDTKNN